MIEIETFLFRDSLFQVLDLDEDAVLPDGWPHPGRNSRSYRNKGNPVIWRTCHICGEPLDRDDGIDGFTCVRCLQTLVAKAEHDLPIFGRVV